MCPRCLRKAPRHRHGCPLGDYPDRPAPCDMCGFLFRKHSTNCPRRTLVYPDLVL